MKTNVKPQISIVEHSQMGTALKNIHEELNAVLLQKGVITADFRGKLTELFGTIHVALEEKTSKLKTISKRKTFSQMAKEKLSQAVDKSKNLSEINVRQFDTIISGLRSALEDVMFEDHGKQMDKSGTVNNWWHGIYFGEHPTKKV